eukprot:SAG31_NODE_4759_length_2974_cov_1.820522_2_plen_149_part_00
MRSKTISYKRLLASGPCWVRPPAYCNALSIALQCSIYCIVMLYLLNCNALSIALQCSIYCMAGDLLYIAMLFPRLAIYCIAMLYPRLAIYCIAPLYSRLAIYCIAPLYPRLAIYCIAPLYPRLAIISAPAHNRRIVETGGPGKACGRS